MSEKRHVHLGLWLQYLHSSGWQSADSRAEEVNTLAPYSDIAQAAEAAKLDAVIRGDGVGFHKERATSPYAGSLELITLLAALAARTESIGLIGTASTTFSEPYTLARQLATVDHLSGGRVGWNIVTSHGGEKNYGFADIPDQDARYARADEFVDVVRKLWASWEPGAVTIDKATGQFTDPDKIHEIDHVGEHFNVAGPLNVSRSPQGRPVLVQAGSSERGRQFAARHAEIIFTAHQEIGTAFDFAQDLRRRVAQAGRDPKDVKILPGLGLFLGETEAEANAAYEEEIDRIDYDATRTRLEELFGGVDLSGVGLDERIPAELLPDTSTLARRQSRPQIFVDLANQGATFRKVLQSVAGGFGHGKLVGTPEQAADRIQEWFEAGAADGFVIFPNRGLTSVRLFTQAVVPILQQRGLFRTEYEGTTLRDHFGLPPVVDPQEEGERADAAA